MRSGSCVFEGKAEACGFLNREKSGARYIRFSRQVSFSAHTLFQDSCVLDTFLLRGRGEAVDIVR